MQGLLKHKLLIGLVAVFIVAGAGGAYAATQSNSDPRQALLNDVAKRLNVSPAKLRAAVQGALLDRIQAAVKAGQLTQAQANALEQRVQKGGLPFGPFGGRGPFGGPREFFHRGFGPPGLIAPGPPGLIAPGPRGLVAPGPPRIGPIAAAATYLGLSADQLFKDLGSGKTLAQVAKAQNKSVSGLEQAIVSAQKSMLDKLVAAGFIAKAREQRALSRLSSRVDQLVNHGQIEIAPGFKGTPRRPADIPGPPPGIIAVPPGPAGMAVPQQAPPPPGA